VRLYLVDTPEAETAYRDRIGEQAAYFGITPAQPIDPARQAAAVTDCPVGSRHVHRLEALALSTRAQRSRARLRDRDRRWRRSKRDARCKRVWRVSTAHARPSTMAETRAFTWRTSRSLRSRRKLLGLAAGTGPFTWPRGRIHCCGFGVEGIDALPGRTN
jgi:hypothetical protein